MLSGAGIMARQYSQELTGIHYSYRSSKNGQSQDKARRKVL
jgi:hypothetical protein